MDVLVTGASGHVGAALLHELLNAGHRVRALVRSDTRSLRGLDVEPLRGDVTDAESLARACKGAEVVLHAAARIALQSKTDPETERTNVEGTRNVLHAARAAGIRRVVHFSSAHAAAAGASQYERTKASAEVEVQRAVAKGMDVVVLRPCAVIGPHDHKPSPMGRVLMLIATRRLPATVRGGQSWVDVRDVARSAVRAMSAGRSGACYTLAGHWQPMSDLAALTARAAGVSPPLLSVPTRVARAFAPVVERGFLLLRQPPLVSASSMDALESIPRPMDPDAARDLGHQRRSLESTLEDAVSWYEQQGMIRRGRR